jgi:predicted nucleotidyltransferase
VATPDLPALRRAVGRCLSNHRDIEAAWVFGSVASGRARPDSDIDIAVLLNRRVRLSRRLAYRLRLMADLGAALRRPDVDVVILNSAPPLLAHRVLCRGRLVFERSKTARVRYQVETARQYFDLVPVLEARVRSFKKAVRETRVGG